MSRRIFLIAALAWTAPAVALPLAAAREIRLAADIWCPYNCDPHSDHPGFAVEIAREVFAASGDTVDYQVMSWPRSIVEARAGHVDGIIGAIPADAPDFVYPLEPAGHSSLGMAVLAGSDFQFHDAVSFEGKVIGSITGYAMNGVAGRYIAAHANDPDRVQLIAGNDALDQNLRKLLANRVDIVVDDHNVLAQAIGRLGLSDQVKIVFVTPGSDLYIAMSPSTPDAAALTQTLSRGIARLRASGRLAAILARYHVADWK